MGKGLRIKCNSNDLFLYLIFIPFLYPRGFSEYFSVYKMFFTGWMYAAMLLVMMFFGGYLCKYGVKNKKYLVWMILYHIVLLIETLVLQGGIKEGLQKLFAAPILCLGCSIFLEKNAKRFMKCIANILIVDFALNLVIFNPIFFGEFFSPTYNILFIGHVHVASQMGVLGIFVALLLENIEPSFKRRCNYLIVLAIVTMIMSLTSAAIICLVVLFIGVSVSRKVKNEKIFSLDFRIYVIFAFFFDGLFMAFLSRNNWNLSKFGLTTSFNGRFTIWRKIASLLENHWIFGYGSYGTRIQVYWSAWSKKTEGMTYAHNQIFQVLLDGGIVLLIFFIIMLFSYLSGSKRIISKKIKKIACVFLITTLVIMVTESLTEYYYIFMLWSLFAYLPNLNNIWKNKTGD